MEFYIQMMLKPVTEAFGRMHARLGLTRYLDGSSCDLRDLPPLIFVLYSKGV